MGSLVVVRASSPILATPIGVWASEFLLLKSRCFLFAGLHDMLSHLAVLDVQRARSAAEGAKGCGERGLYGGSGDPGHEAPAVPHQPDETVRCC